MPSVGVRKSLRPNPPYAAGFAQRASGAAPSSGDIAAVVALTLALAVGSEIPAEQGVVAIY